MIRRTIFYRPKIYLFGSIFIIQKASIF